MQSINYVEMDRIQDNMYATVLGSICFRRLNATHSTGCGSTLGGSVGVLHLIESNSDFDFVLNSPPSPPYTLIVKPAQFTRENILNLKTNAMKNISGIVVIDDRSNLVSFSHESKCPNQYSGLDEQTCDANQANATTWNPFGTGLLQQDFPFPIVYVKDADSIEKMINCTRKYNKYDMDQQRGRALCSIQIKSFMLAAVNSVVCIRRTKYANNMNPRRYCDPLQGKNIYATAYPRKVVPDAAIVTTTNEEFIVVAARIDTTSMFDGIGLGAMDSLLPTITLLSTAHTLVKMLSDGDSAKNVLFILFNGESYDYIGSQRLVYDMENGDFPSLSTQTQPIHLKNITLFIDIGSLDSLNSTTIYQYKTFSMASEFINSMQRFNKKFNLNLAIGQKSSSNLPPTSAQTFLRENVSFPAVILYSDANKNHFYHSIYDDGKNIRFNYQNTSQDFTNLVDITTISPFQSDSIQIATRNFASLLAHTLYSLIKNQDYGSSKAANPYLIDELFHCYLNTTNCRAFRAAVKDPQAIVFNPSPPQRYISVPGSLAVETIGWTYRILGFLTGRKQPNHSIDNCTTLPLNWFAGIDGTGECMLTTQNLSSAYSPAFTIDNYDWKSRKYSTWTESTWNEINVRIFLKPAVQQEAFTLAIGVVVMVLSTVIIYLINSKSDVLFGESTSSINVLTLPSQC